MAFTNIDSTKPSGTEKISTADNYIRELKIDVETNLAEISGYPNNVALKDAVWTTATRPSSNLVSGLSGYNSTIGAREYWNGSSWIAMGAAATHSHSGGDITSAVNSAAYAGTCTGNSATATYATSAGSATYATSANSASYATSAGNATYATSAGNATACSGNSATASKLATPRIISLSGAITGSVSFDGSNNANISTSSSYNSALDSLLPKMKGSTQPTLTEITNWSSMVKNINNGTTGISARSNGNIYLTQPYTNFDEILILSADDNGDAVAITKYKRWELQLMFQMYRFDLLAHRHEWRILGTGQGSTTTTWLTSGENCGIVGIYGITY